jgi:predicted XRE-type DNA-binding protein
MPLVATKVMRSSGNVFRDLGFGSQEAGILRIRSQLMVTLSDIIEDRQLTQAQAAALFVVSQPRVSDLVRGKIDRFSIDTLVEMLDRVGVAVDLILRPRGAPSRHRSPITPRPSRRRRTRQRRS